MMDVHTTYFQYQNVIKYIYSSTVLQKPTILRCLYFTCVFKLNAIYTTLQLLLLLHFRGILYFSLINLTVRVYLNCRFDMKI